MVGVVRTEELNTRHLEAGAIVVLLSEEDLEIVTIEHIDPEGDWIVMTSEGSKKVAARDKLCKLVILTDTRIYPLKFNQWAKSIKNGEVNTFKQVTFKPIPAKFKSGKVQKVCNTCFSHFIGSKSQADCKKCCDENLTAQIKIEKKVKSKRPRIKSTDEIKAIALTSFRMGMKSDKALENPEKVFIAWLEKQF